MPASIVFAAVTLAGGLGLVWATHRQWRKSKGICLVLLIPWAIILLGACGADLIGKQALAFSIILNGTLLYVTLWFGVLALIAAVWFFAAVFGLAIAPFAILARLIDEFSEFLRGRGPSRRKDREDRTSGRPDQDARGDPPAGQS
jgi:hypothetical protein